MESGPGGGGPEVGGGGKAIERRVDTLGNHVAKAAGKAAGPGVSDHGPNAAPAGVDMGFPPQLLAPHGRAGTGREEAGR